MTISHVHIMLLCTQCLYVGISSSTLFSYLLLLISLECTVDLIFPLYPIQLSSCAFIKITTSSFQQPNSPQTSLVFNIMCLCCGARSVFEVLKFCEKVLKHF